MEASRGVDRSLIAGLKITALLFAALELVTLSGIARQPHEIILAWFGGGNQALAAGLTLGHIHLLYAFTCPGWRAYLRTAGAGVALFGLLAVIPAVRADLGATGWLLLLGTSLGVATLGALGFKARPGEPERLLRTQARELLIICLLLVAFFNCVASSALYLTAALHPHTFDPAAYHLDAALGFQPSAYMAVLARALAPLDKVLEWSYEAIYLGIIFLFASEVRRRRLPTSPVVLFMVASSAGWLLYHLCPIAGPRYLFQELFPLGLPAAHQVTYPTLLTPWAARNAMPSMHMAGALLIWMNASHLGGGIRAAAAVLAGLTALATLSKGEHYFIDLVAAVPTAVALQAACTFVLRWDEPARRNAAVTGAVLLLAWIAAVRFGVELFAAYPVLLWILMVGTLVASVRSYGTLARATGEGLGRSAAPASPKVSREAQASSQGAFRAIGVMFAISGFAGLMYQVLFAKSLALTFGSTSTATYTVLATYMGGMALGAWLGGRLADGRRDPLVLYAFCELGIGLYCVATPWIFTGIQALYVAVGSGLPPDAGILLLARIALGVVALAAPTVLMGMTLPVVARFFEQRAVSLGASVSFLYGLNTAGAAAGALLAGYFIIPALGVFRTTLSAAALNLLAAAIAFRIVKQLAAAQDRVAESQPARPAEPGREDFRCGVAGLLILGVGGIVTLALEVNYMHLLAVLAGNSVYAFSLMLFAFLIGLGGGAALGRWLLLWRVPLALCLAWLEFALAGVILGGVYLWGSLSPYFASFEAYTPELGFGARELIRGMVCLVAMVPPAIAIGALYPVAMEAVGRMRPGSAIPALGRAASLNTLGNIVGVLIAGFLLLPAIGALRSIQLLAVICLLLGLAALAMTAHRNRPAAWSPAALVAVLLALQPASFNYTALASGANVYFMSDQFGEVIDHAESVDGGLTTVSRVVPPGHYPVLTLKTNGKFQGNNGGEMAAQVGLALAPLVHTDARDSALVIGYGSGMSSRTLSDSGFRSMDVVDLSADIVRLADTHFPEINGRVSQRPGVQLHITDGRNFLMLQDRRYDLVSLEISSIWFAGAAALYNQEFYRLVKRRLAAGGVLQQWVQLHHITPLDVVYVLGSVRSEFRYVWVYFIGGQGIIVASNDAARAPSAQRLAALIAKHRGLIEMTGDRFDRKALEAPLLGPDGVDRLLGALGKPPATWVSTDDNLYLEYSTPKGNALSGSATQQVNVELLMRFAPPAAR